jgi:hypothetical protein
MAGTAGVDALYHYQPFDPDRLADILTNNRVYCSNPATFNDPWDCKPFFDVDIVDDPVMHQQIAERFISTREGGQHGDPMNDELRRNPKLVKRFLEAFTETFSNEFVASRFGIYCLSKCADSALMWSHYARNHTGICLHFRVSGTKFSNAWEVEYQKEYPVITFGKLTDTIRILIVKSDVWSYEEEFRLVCPRDTQEPDHPLLLNGGYLSFENRALTSIIVGCQADYGAIKTFVATHAPQLPVRKAVRAPNKYRLIIEG